MGRFVGRNLRKPSARHLKNREGRLAGKGSRKHRVRRSEKRGEIAVDLNSKDIDQTRVDGVEIEHFHDFPVIREVTAAQVKETIVLERMPDFQGDTLEIQGRIKTDRDLAYDALHVFDAAGAIDHFAEMSLHRNKDWCVSIRRAWLEGRVFPVYVDPTLSVAGNDIHVFRRTTTCFPARQPVVMEEFLDPAEQGHERRERQDGVDVAAGGGCFGHRSVAPVRGGLAAGRAGRD